MTDDELDEIHERLDELERQIETRLDAIEREIERVDSNATGAHARIGDLADRVANIEAEISGPTVIPGTKKALAVEIAQRVVVARAVKRSGQFAGKASITVNDVQTAAEGRDDRAELRRKTIHDAFRALADTTDGFELQRGKPGSDSRDTQLRFDADMNPDLADRLDDE